MRTVINFLPSFFKVWRLFPKRFCWEFLQRCTQPAIPSGPFQGMKYAGKNVGSAFWPKALGIYEKEIAIPFQDALMQMKISTFIDIGAAEGYYACGAAFLRQDLNVIAFEQSTEGRTAIEHLAHLNCVSSQIKVLGKCTIETLRKVISANSFILMDVEGSEKELLNPILIPQLRKVSIIVECHDFIYRDTTELLAKRFSDTHTIMQIKSENRSITELPCKLPWWLLPMHKHYLQQMISEGRPSEMTWLFMQPIS